MAGVSKDDVAEAVASLKASPHFHLILQYLIERYEGHLETLLLDENGQQNIEMARGKAAELHYVLQKLGARR